MSKGSRSPATRRKGPREPGGPSLSEQLFRSITSQGWGASELARAAGVDHAQVSRFLRGERGLSLGTADKLASALGLRLVEGGRARNRPRPAAQVVTTEPAAGPIAEEEPTAP